jgi:hypothetical protein
MRYCDGCGGEVPEGRRKWCSRACARVAANAAWRERNPRQRETVTELVQAMRVALDGHIAEHEKLYRNLDDRLDAIEERIRRSDARRGHEQG